MNLSETSFRTEPLPAELAAALAHAKNRLEPIAARIHWHSQVSSTNDIAGTLANGDAPEGTIVIADAQTAGRGRLGRTWSSVPGAGLYLSMILRPERRVVPLLTIAAGVAIADGIRTASGLSVALKWPNDVMVESRKLAGILAEASSSAAGVAHVVLGIGINVKPGAWPPEVAARATSIETELGRAVDRGVVLAECLAAFASRYDDLNRGRAAEVLTAWRAYARPLFGRGVEWDGPEGTMRGVAAGVDDVGALIVRTDEGTIRVMSGEVRWI